MWQGYKEQMLLRYFQEFHQSYLGDYSNFKEFIPIYKGASEALIRKPFVVHPFFGIDGIGDRPDVFPEVGLLYLQLHGPQ